MYEYVGEGGKEPEDLYLKKQNGNIIEFLTPSWIFSLNFQENIFNSVHGAFLKVQVITYFQQNCERMNWSNDLQNSTFFMFIFLQRHQRTSKSRYSIPSVLLLHVYPKITCKCTVQYMHLLPKAYLGKIKRSANTI
jgi:hypothetical protein